MRMRVFVVCITSVAALACNNTQTSCVGCLDDPPRICNSSCLTRIATGDGGSAECECVAGECGVNTVTYTLVCDDEFCQCAATGIIGNAGGSFASPPNVCESDVSVIEGLFNTRCTFPPQ
jgi:hypothetical protein